MTLTALRGQSGIIALPSILVIALLVFVAGMGVASSGFFEVAMGVNDGDAKEALAVAEAGVRDGLMRLARNTLCNEGGTPACSAYLLSFGQGSASIAITGTGGSKTIRSTGIVRNSQKLVQVAVSIDANDKVSVSAWAEVTN